MPIFSLIYPFILRPLILNYWRTLSVILTLTLGSAVFLSIRLANEASLLGFKKAVEMTSGKPILEFTSLPFGLPESAIPSLLPFNEYGILAPIIEADVMVAEQDSKECITLLGVDLLKDTALKKYCSSSVNSKADVILEHQYLQQELLAENTIIINEVVAKKYSLSPRSSFQFIVNDRLIQATVIDIVKFKQAQDNKIIESLNQQPFIVTDIKKAQQWLEQESYVDRIELHLNEGNDLQKTYTAIKALCPANITVQHPKRRSEGAEKMMQAFHFNLMMLSGVALLVGFFLIYHMSSQQALERQAEIAVLKMLGVSKTEIINCFIFQSIIIAIIASILSIPLAYLMAKLCLILTTSTVNALYLTKAAILPDLQIYLWGIAALISLPLSILATIIPIREATQYNPQNLLHDSQNEGRNYKTHSIQKGILVIIILTLIAATLLTIPAYERMPLGAYLATTLLMVILALILWILIYYTSRWLKYISLKKSFTLTMLAGANLSASTHRLTLSASALAVSYTLIVAIAIMVSSFRNTVTLWIKQTTNAQLYIKPASIAKNSQSPSLSPDLIKIIQETPGVISIAPFRFTVQPFNENDMVRVQSLSYQDAAKHDRLAMKSKPSLLELLTTHPNTHNWAIVSESFLFLHHLRIGDVFILPTPIGPQTILIRGEYYDYSSDLGAIMLDESFFLKSYSNTKTNYLSVYTDPNIPTETIKNSIENKMHSSQKVIIYTQKTLMNEVLTIFNSTFAITWALEGIGILVAVLGIIATIIQQVFEQLPHLKTLQRLGFSNQQLNTLITIESTFLAFLIHITGACLGIILSMILIFVVNPQSFGWTMPVTIPWSFILASFILGVLMMNLTSRQALHTIMRKYGLTALFFFSFYLQS
jgi:putative ABC transport system permease protein